MDRVDLDAAFQPLPPIKWPGGGEVEVKPISFAQQRTAAKLEKGELDVFEALPKLVAALVPSKSVETIENELDAEQMWLVVHYAARNGELVKKYLEQIAGNALAGTGQGSPPPTPTGPSSAALPAPTPLAAPCGAS